MINKNDYINLSKADLNNNFLNACQEGNLEIVKYLLTSPELKEYVDINILNDYGFRSACE